MAFSILAGMQYDFQLMPLPVLIGMRILEVLFFGGWIGAIIVVIISGIEDIHTILQKDVPGTPATAVGGDHDLT